MPFWQPFQQFLAKSWILSLRDRERSNNYFPSKKIFKRSAGHVGCNFDKVIKLFDTKNGIISLNKQKALAKLLLSKETSLNCTSEHVERSFDNPASIFCVIVQIFLLEVRRWIKKTIFLQIFPPIFFLY